MMVDLPVKNANFFSFVKGFSQFSGKACAYVINTVCVAMFAQELQRPTCIKDVDKIS